MSAAALPGDQAKVSVLVRVPPEIAFRVFTTEIDQWWRRGLRYRVAGKRRGIIRLEEGVGGRLFESFDGATTRLACTEGANGNDRATVGARRRPRVTCARAST